LPKKHRLQPKKLPRPRWTDPTFVGHKNLADYVFPRGVSAWLKNNLADADKFTEGLRKAGLVE